MQKLTIAALLSLLMSVFVAVSMARADAVLLMVEEKWCEWCEQWNSDIGGIYAKTEEGKQAPLRRTDIHDPMPADVELKSRVHYTPTFILLSKGKEIGRIEGYPGEDFFWGLLQQLLKKLPKPNAKNAGLFLPVGVPPIAIAGG